MALIGATLPWLACLPPPTPAPPTPAELSLWSPPAAPSQPDALRIDPARLAVSLAARVPEPGPIELHVIGARADAAHCQGPGVTWQAGTLRVTRPASPGIVDVRCQAGDAVASAQITFTGSATLPVRDPYAGGVVLFKLRRAPRRSGDPAGTRELGLPDLDALLAALDAYAFPAFPFDRQSTLDRVGLRRWIVIDLPEHVNFYQAVAWLRASRRVYAESYLAEDAAFLRVQRRGGSWPFEFRTPTDRTAEDAEPPQRSGGGRGSRGRLVSRRARPQGMPSWDLEAIGAPEAWARTDGEGVGIAIIDTGVDTNHVAVSTNLRWKPEESASYDADGNGVPGDQSGVNFAHLAITRSGGRAALGLGLLTDVSDWDGLRAGSPTRLAGHGTALAALAAGQGALDGRLGVAPGAWLLPIDVQENLRTTRSRLLEEDPRMRSHPQDPERDPPLRESVWARALGTAYAAREGARVMSCAWPASRAHWILHDALLYAEDNCLLAVCAARETQVLAARPRGPGYPLSWARGEPSRQDEGSGAVYDAWTGTRRGDFFERPLRALLVAEPAERPPRPASRATERIRVPLRSPRGGQAIRSAVSDPRNDTGPLPDRRRARFAAPSMAAGIVAGAAALVVSLRPDLAPESVRRALLESMRTREAKDALWLPAALDALRSEPLGSCDRPERGDRATESPRWWQRVRVRGSLDHPFEPAAPQRRPRWP